MTQIYIPQYRLVDEPPGKPHYVYIVEVVESGRLHKVERRYSAFHCLHRELRKNFTTPLFPPKRVRSCQRKVLERRRQCLEQYLQAMLRFGPSRAQVFAFLGLQRPNDELECVDDVTTESMIEHQAVYTYKRDPYLEAEVCTSLPDVVTQDILQHRRTQRGRMMVGRLQVQQCVVFVGVWVLYAATYLLRKPLGVMKGALGHDLTFSKLQLGCLDTAILLPYALVQMCCSRVADVTSPRCTITVCLFLAGLSVLTFGSWSRYGVLFCLLALSGAMQAPVWPACCKCLSAWFPDDVLNTVFGLISTSVYGGSIIATAFASYLYATYGWRFVFLPLAVVSMGLALAAWPVTRLPGDLGMVVPGKASTNQNTVRSELSFTQLWCLPVVPQLSFAMLSLKLVRYTVYLWLPVYLMQGLGQSAATAGLLISLFDVGGIVGSMLLGLLADRHASLFHTWLAVVVSSFTFLAFLFTSSWGPVYNGALLLAAGFCVCGPDSLLGGSVAVAVGEQDGKNSGAAVAGLINGFGSLGGVIEGPLVGYVSEAYSWNTMFLLMVVLLSAGSFCILQAFLIQRRQRQARYLPLHNGI